MLNWLRRKRKKKSKLMEPLALKKRVKFVEVELNTSAWVLVLEVLVPDAPKLAKAGLPFCMVERHEEHVYFFLCPDKQEVLADREFYREISRLVRRYDKGITNFWLLVCELRRLSPDKLAIFNRMEVEDYVAGRRSS